MQTAHQRLVPVPCDPGSDVCAFQVLELWTSSLGTLAVRSLPPGEEPRRRFAETETVSYVLLGGFRELLLL